MQLPPGFHFHPTDVELVRHYLKRKLSGKRIAFDAISELDIYKYAPWDLPGKSRLHGWDRKSYFFCSVNKYGRRGVESNRSTELGYWKSTGKDWPVFGCGDRVVGMVKTLVFHLGRSPRGEKTDWLMYEYRIEEDEELRDCGGAARDGCVLCAVFKKDGLGLRVGAHYGALFGEEDWENDGNGLTAPVPLLDMVDAHNCLDSNLNVSDNLTVWSVDDVTLPHCSPPGYDGALDFPRNAHEDDDILSMLAMFGEENTSDLGNDLIEVEDRINCSNACTNSASDGVDICFGFEDLENIEPLADSVYSISDPCSAKDSVDQLHCFNEGHFLELMDLDVPLSCSKEPAEDETLEADCFLDFNIYENDAEQPGYMPGADAFFAASFNQSATDQTGVNGKLDLPCIIADSGTLGLQGESAPVQMSSSRGDHAHSVIFVKKLKDGVVFCHCYDSSTHVKAEVTRCTKDALSDKLEESSFTYVHGCHVLQFGKGIASSNTYLTFMFVRFCIVLATSIRSMLKESWLIIWFYLLKVMCMPLSCHFAPFFTILMSLLLLDSLRVFLSSPVCKIVSQ